MSEKFRILHIMPDIRASMSCRNSNRLILFSSNPLIWKRKWTHPFQLSIIDDHEQFTGLIRHIFISMGMIRGKAEGFLRFQ